MSSRAQQLINHASRLLDLRADVAGAEAALREAIRLSQAEGKWVTQAQASTFLGEVLAQTARPEEALPLFENVINLAMQAGLDPGTIDHEVRIARQHLAKAAGVE